MQKILFRLPVLAVFISSFAVAAWHDSLPEKYWRYMDGYKYQYSGNCLVRWNPASAEFIVPDACSVSLYERLNSDAIKSIEYMRSKSGANNFSEYYSLLEGAHGATQKRATAVESSHEPASNYSEEQATIDAIDLWRQACVNAKSLNWVPFYKVAERYPGISKIHAARLFSNANDTVKGLGGMINCAEQAQYVVRTYASDIDIRATDRK